MAFCIDATPSAVKLSSFIASAPAMFARVSSATNPFTDLAPPSVEKLIHKQVSQSARVCDSSRSKSPLSVTSQQMKKTGAGDALHKLVSVTRQIKENGWGQTEFVRGWSNDDELRNLKLTSTDWLFVKLLFNPIGLKKLSVQEWLISRRPFCNFVAFENLSLFSK